MILVGWEELFLGYYSILQRWREVDEVLVLGLIGSVACGEELKASQD